MKNAEPCSWLLLGGNSEWAVSLAHHSGTYRLSDKIMKASGRRNDLQNGLHGQVCIQTPSGQGLVLLSLNCVASAEPASEFSKSPP